MIQAAGGAALLCEPGQPSPRLAWEQVADAAPEVIVFSPCGYDLAEAREEAASLYDLPAFAETPAARGGDVFAVDATSYLSRPGPRIVDGLEILAWAIHPEAFPQPASDRVVRVPRG
jgi:iron complex transport system substrate-binding protein